MSKKLKYFLLMVAIVAPFAGVAYYQIGKMEQEIITHTHLTQECREKGGSYYTKYEQEGIGCYQLVQERITKKLY